MNSGKSAEVTIDTSQHKAARVAGFMFLFAFLVPTLNWTLGLSRFIVVENVVATAKNIIANEWLFRVGIAVELIMSVGLIVLAVALYTVLKTVNRNLALLALSLKLVEAAIVAAIVLASFIALRISDGATSLTAFTPEQLLAPVGFLLNQHTIVYSIPMVFLGLNMTVFFYLFLRSKYIPGLLAGFGILSFAIILIHALGNILAPRYATMTVVEFICYTPSGIAEIVVGMLLLVKGIKVPQDDSRTSESPETAINNMR